MTILDQKEPSISLKLIVLVISLISCAAFAGLFVLGGAQANAHQHEAAAQTGQF